MRIAIIGYGNPVRTDDAFGQVVVRQLADGLNDLPAVSCLACQQLLPEQVTLAADADWLILIDVSAEVPVGGVRLRRVIGSPDRLAGNGTHRMNPDELVGLARSLGTRPAHCLLITAGGRSFDAGETLTPALADLANRLANGLAKRIRKCAGVR